MENSRNNTVSIKKTLADIIDEIDTEINDRAYGEPHFSDSRYHPKTLTSDNVKRIPRVQDGERKIAFVDGGSTHLLLTPMFCVSLIRVYYSLFNGTKRIIPQAFPQRFSFYAYVSATNENGDIQYKSKIFPQTEPSTGILPREHDLDLSSWDRSIMTGNVRAPIERVASAVRRFAEWKLATVLTSRVLHTNDIIVRDGTLQTMVTNESRYANELYAEAERNNVIVTGVAKTSRLYTTTGNSLTAVIRQLGEKKYPNEQWYYYPVADVTHPDHQAELYYAKFHPKAEYIFRYELYREQAKTMSREEKETILGILTNNARDITFPGYLYGLIDADRFSRVRFDEVENHIAMLKAEASKHERWDRLKPYLQALDAHDKLNDVVGI